jgi:hypothetical protein
MPDAKQKYTVSGGNIKFDGKWYKPQDTIELTANDKKQIAATASHIKLTKVS